MVQGGDGKGRFHPPVHGVSDDPVRMQVLDRAQVQLALPGVVRCDVREPFPVRGHGAEVPFNEVIVDRRAGLEPCPAPAVDHREDAVLRAQPPDPAFTGPQAGTGIDLIGDEPVSEGRIVAVVIDGSVDQVRFFPVPGRDRVGGPLVVGLSGEIQHLSRTLPREP